MGTCTRLDFSGLAKNPVTPEATPILTFMIFSRFTYLLGPYHNHFESSNARREAISLVNKNSSVLTTNDLAPHLSKRKNIQFTNSNLKYNLENFDEILLDLEKPGWQSNKEFVKKIQDEINLKKLWFKKYEKDNIILFEKLNF